MTRKLFKTTKGQISTEIMYAVGVMIVIFLLLTGVTMNRKSELRKMDDYLQKRNECFRISNAISSLTAAGFNTQAILTLPPFVNTVRVYVHGRIVVDFDPNSKKETPCTYIGAVYDDPNDSKDYVELLGGKTYVFKNVNEQVQITVA